MEPDCYSPVAQLVEQAAVNRLVVGSSPTGGARFSATKPADNPVNAPRREFRLSAFRVSCLSRRGLRRSAGPRGALRFEKDKAGSERNRGGCFRTLEFESETLGLSV